MRMPASLECREENDHARFDRLRAALSIVQLGLVERIQLGGLLLIAMVEPEAYLYAFRPFLGICKEIWLRTLRQIRCSTSAHSHLHCQLSEKPKETLGYGEHVTHRFVVLCQGLFCRLEEIFPDLSTFRVFRSLEPC